MTVSIGNSLIQTSIFALAFTVTLLLSVRKDFRESLFSPSRTQELKGFAILSIIFSHIGYFLSSNTTFLYPFSALGGVGVNLFLFLSGFGLTASALKYPTSILGFYKKRLAKIFLPMWVVLAVVILIDILIFRKTYELATIWESFIGFYPEADVFSSLDSPLWYFSLILFYYLIFPLLFWEKLKYFCPLLILLATYLVFSLTLPVESSVLKLYKLHFLAFPLGILSALLFKDPKWLIFQTKIKSILINRPLKWMLGVFFLCIASYTTVHSGVGDRVSIEQSISLVTMFSFIIVFIIKGWEFKILNIFGKFSYEIYLIHWPILIRYSLLYLFLPSSIATYSYLGIFLSLGWALQKLLSLKTYQSPRRHI